MTAPTTSMLDLVAQSAFLLTPMETAELNLLCDRLSSRENIVGGLSYDLLPLSTSDTAILIHDGGWQIHWVIHRLPTIGWALCLEGDRIVMASPSLGALLHIAVASA